MKLPKVLWWCHVACWQLYMGDILWASPMGKKCCSYKKGRCEHDNKPCDATRYLPEVKDGTKK
jgi:hypothetical protein